MPTFASSRTAFVFLLLAGLLVWITPAWAVTTTVNVGPSLTNTFSPSSVTINPGDAIKWQWISGFHTTTSGVFAEGPNGLWDSPIDAGTTSFTRTFSISGIYPYYCQFHGFSGMTGTITVGTISCSIAGPTPVCANASGLSYTATIAPAGGAQTFSWSITGNGTIVGSSTAATVSVSSTGAGSFTLTMLGTKSGTQVMCTKVVTVSTATTCTINGNASVLTGSTGNGYTSTVSPAGGTVTYSWSISGNGSITSGTTASSCTVTAGAVGSFTLTLNVIRSGCPGSCQKVVTVITPSCTISGPTPVFAGSTGNGYTSTVSPAGGVIVYSWSISGNGSITSATNTSSVTVTAGAAGSFTLTLDGTRDGTSFQCTKPVTVDPAPSCVVAGPDTVAASSTGTIYAANISPSGGTQTHSWSITGNGSITSGTSGPSVTVTAGASGSFTVIHDGTRDGIALSCQKTVTIQAPTGIGGNAMNRFRLMPSPNPFADKVRLQFTLDRETRVVLDIFDLGGQKVLSLLTADLTEGPHEVTWGGWDSRHQPVVPGVYFARLETGDGRMKVQKIFKSR